MHVMRVGIRTSRPRSMYMNLIILGLSLEALGHYFTYFSCPGMYSVCTQIYIDVSVISMGTVLEL